MLLGVLKDSINTMKRWAIVYFIAIIMACIIVFSIFRNANYPVGQVAVVIVVPIFTIIAIIRIAQYFSSGKKQQRQKRKELEVQQKIPIWFKVTSVTFTLVFISSLIVSMLFLFSGGIYSLLGLDWASKVAINNITIPSLITVGISFLCLITIIFAFIIDPYWPNIIRIFKRRFSLWSGMTKEIRINGYRFPIHH